MNVNTINIGLRVRDIDKSTAFITTMLGDSAMTIEIPGETSKQQIRIVGSKETGIFFDLYADDSDDTSEEDSQFGLIQYCLGVENVDEAYGKALEAGATEMSAPVDVDIEPPDRPGLRVRTRLAHVYDPDGVVCEFVDSGWIEKM